MHAYFDTHPTARARLAPPGRRLAEISSCLAAAVLALVLASASTALAATAVYLYPAEELHLAGTSHAQLNGVTCPSGGYCVAVGTAGATGGGSNTFPVVLGEEPTLNHLGEASWRDYTPALPTPSTASTYNSLESVACIDPLSCLAVGAYGAGGSELPLVEVGSDAGAWRPGALVTLPSAHQVAPVAASLAAVSCVPQAVAAGSGHAQGTCLAVGTYAGSSGSNKAMAVFLAGGPAQAVEIFPPHGAEAGSGAHLTAVSCFTGSCLAVGDYTDARGSQQGMAVIENNGTFKASVEVSAPVDSAGLSTKLTGVSCVAGSKCAISGSYLAQSDDLPTPMIAVLSGSTWGPSIQIGLRLSGAKKPAQLNSVWCTASGACAAVGSFQGFFGPRPFVVDDVAGHWGLQYGVGLYAKADLKDTLNFASIACWSPGNCAVVGEITPHAGNVEPIDAVTSAPPKPAV